jgi:hypothetical protein
MASFLTNKGVTSLIDGTVKLYSDTIKVMLLGAGLVPSKLDTAVNLGAGTDAATNEVTCTGYARGWGGAGRQVVTPTISVDNTNNGCKIVIPNPTWAGLGGAVNTTIAMAAIIKEGGSNDTTSIILAYLDCPDTPTNGSPFTLTLDQVNGELYFRV